MNERVEIPTLSKKEELVLKMLITSGEKYGLEMVKTSSGELKRGTIYVTLSRMKDKGYVTSRVEETPEGKQGPARRLFQVTGHGQRVYDFWQMASQQWGGSLVPA